MPLCEKCDVQQSRGIPRFTLAMSPSHSHKSRNLGLAFFLNLGFAVIEIIGGFFSNSVAILSDALHDFGDSLALGLAWYLERKAETLKPSPNYSYGFARLRLMGALVNSLILLLGSFLILKESVERFQSDQIPDSELMLYLGVIGLIFNGIAFIRLEGGSLNQKMVRMHLLEDILGWLAVLLGALLIHFTNWYFIDPLLSILIALFILRGVYFRLRETIDLLLQRSPEGIDPKDLEEVIRKHASVCEVHHLHLWSLDGEHHVLTAHVVLDKSLPSQALDSIRNELIDSLSDFSLSHHTLQFEFSEQSCQLGANTSSKVHE